MTPQLHSEFLKQRTTGTNLGLFLAMVSVIAAVVLLHMVTLPTQALLPREGQLKVLGLGTTFGMIFASILGALSITSEIRHGLIRPTFLATPKRARVIAAKTVFNPYRTPACRLATAAAKGSVCTSRAASAVLFTGCILAFGRFLLSHCRH